jgi:hypothetical protein
MDDAYSTEDLRDSILVRMANGKDIGQMKRDLEAYRLKTYLLAYFGKDDLTDYGQGKILGVCQACGMWSTQRRMRFLDKDIGGGMVNAFNVSRYLEGPVKMKLDFSDKK